MTMPVRSRADEATKEGASEASGTSCANAVARKVQGHYDGVRDLTARFTQTSQVVSLGAEASAPAVASSGEVSFAKPGKMRWAYEQPESSLVVTDGEELWIYDPAEQEAQRFRTAHGFLSGAALQFLLGHGEMSRDFKVKALACASDDTRLDLVPRKAAPYERLEVRVDPATGEVKETAVFDLVGNVTRVGFQEVRTNTGLGDELFRFTPPGGVRVVEVPTAEP
jgi:outer membrane lipoprotein carrier protein